MKNILKVDEVWRMYNELMKETAPYRYPMGKETQWLKSVEIIYNHKTDKRLNQRTRIY